MPHHNSSVISSGTDEDSVAHSFAGVSIHTESYNIKHFS